MHAPRLLCAAPLLPLFLCTQASYATLIVNGVAKNAADTNPGTQALPLKTIGAAAKRVQPGDAVLVQPGVYREAVHLIVSGTEGNPITFRSAVPYAAVIEGADPVVEFRPEGTGAWSFAAPRIATLGTDANAGEWIPAEAMGRLSRSSSVTAIDAGASSVVIEDGYGNTSWQTGGRLALTASFVPTYVHDVGQTVRGGGL